MSIRFKPNGIMDISSDGADLPQETDGLNIASGAMKRCKNLRLGQGGVAKTRDGSRKLNETALDAAADFIIEQGGVRYTFVGENVFRNETAVGGVQCATPTFDPVAGAYAAEQTVTISSATPHVVIYYTTDGITPGTSSQLYTVPIVVPLWRALKAIAVRQGFVDSDIGLAYYSATLANFVTETDVDTFITETDSDNFINEGIA